MFGNLNRQYADIGHKTAPANGKTSRLAIASEILNLAKIFPRLLTFSLFPAFCINRAMGKGEFLGEFEQVVLLAVACLEGKGYGMTIRREIEERTARRVSIGPVYSTLRRLEGKGYLSSRVGEATPVRGGRATRYFRIDPTGIRALQASRTMLDQMWEGVWFEPQREGT